MSSSAPSIKDYLAALPGDRRAAVIALRKTILANLPDGYRESVSSKYLAYEVPLEVYPDTYNKRPLMYVAVASQKGHIALHLCHVYGSPSLRKELELGYKNAGKKLDMGGGCLRFKKLDDLPLDVIATSVAALPMKDYVAFARQVHSKEARSARSGRSAEAKTKTKTR